MDEDVNRVAEIKERYFPESANPYEAAVTPVTQAAVIQCLRDIDHLLREVERESNNRIATEGYVHSQNKEILRLQREVESIKTGKMVPEEELAIAHVENDRLRGLLRRIVTITTTDFEDSGEMALAVDRIHEIASQGDEGE